MLKTIKALVQIAPATARYLWRCHRKGHVNYYALTAKGHCPRCGSYFIPAHQRANWQQAATKNY